MGIGAAENMSDGEAHEHECGVSDDCALGSSNHTSFSVDTITVCLLPNAACRGTGPALGTA